MAIIPGAIGPSAFARSSNVNSERAVNWPLGVGEGGAKAPLWQCPSPGLRVSRTKGYGYILPEGPIRGQFYQDGRYYAVGGTTVYQLFANHTATAYATHVRLDGRPVTFSYNGDTGAEIFITSGGNRYILDLVTNAVTQITTNDFVATMGCYCGGYFLAPVAATSTVRFSDLRDGTTWPALSFFTRELNPDNIVAIAAIYGDVWLLGSKTSEVWTPSGTTSVFAPRLGSTMEQGCAAAFSVANTDNALFWVGLNPDGIGQVFRGQGVGAVPKRVSTFTVDDVLAQAPRLDDVLGWSYQAEGHTYYVLYIPTLDTSWQMDVSLPPEKAWTEIAHWSSTFERWLPFRGVNHAFAFGQHLVGDRASGAIYAQSLNYPTDWLLN